MFQLNVNPSYKFHVSIAAFLGIWVIVFLIVIAPFDVVNLSLSKRLVVIPTYGLILFLSYLSLIPIQNWSYKKIKTWNILFEGIFIICFCSVCFVGCFFYYKSNIINGGSNFWEFLLHIYLPIFTTIVIIIIFFRFFLKQKASNLVSKTILLQGENRFDRLEIPISDLICISSAGNYVEVTYIKQEILQKKVLRNTLKNIQNQETSLLKVHRSHLVNPQHFIEWKAKNIMVLTHTEVIVSKKYRSKINL